MWPFDIKQRRRAADLAARCDLLLHQLTNAREEANSWKWAFRRAGDGDGRLIEQTRAERARTARFRTAWLNARDRAARHHADLVDERATHALTASHFEEFTDEWTDEMRDLRRKLLISEQSRKQLAARLGEVQDANDFLNRQAVTAAGTLAPVEVPA